MDFQSAMETFAEAWVAANAGAAQVSFIHLIMLINRFIQCVCLRDKTYFSVDFSILKHYIKRIQCIRTFFHIFKI